MSIYDDLQPLVSEIMGEFKQGVIFYVHSVPGSGPIENPGEPTETLYSLKATMRGAKWRYVQSGLALAGDLQVTMSVDMVHSQTSATVKMSAVASTQSDIMRGFIVADGIRYKIVGVDPKPAAGTPVAYVLIIRK